MCIRDSHLILRIERHVAHARVAPEVADALGQLIGDAVIETVAGLGPARRAVVLVMRALIAELHVVRAGDVRRRRVERMSADPVGAPWRLAAIDQVRNAAIGRTGPVSYTHLRAHETP